MDRKIIITEDGSHSLQIPGLKETYHSIHGAIQESQHVFIKNGLQALKQSSIRIFEMGFGTGLNALLSYLSIQSQEKHISYTCIEKYPLSSEESKRLNFPEQLLQDRTFFDSLHSAPWDSTTEMDANFTITKIKADLSRTELHGIFDIVFFDAFGPDVQAKLWTKDIFDKLYILLRSGGIFVTYSAKGQVRRNLVEAGFTVERLPGPPGKREMIRATKSISKIK